MRQEQQRLEYFRAVKSNIEFEYTLIGNRIDWLLVSQSFLFVAILINLSSLVSAQCQCEKSSQSLMPLWNNISEAIEIIHNHSLFYPIIPVLGLIVSIAVLLGIWGAIYRIVFYNEKEKKLLKLLPKNKLSYYRYSIRSQSCIPHYIGLIPPVFIPISFIVVWVFIIHHDVPFVFIFSKPLDIYLAALVIPLIVIDIGLSMFCVMFFNNIKSPNELPKKKLLLIIFIVSIVVIPTAIHFHFLRFLIFLIVSFVLSFTFFYIIWRLFSYGEIEDLSS